MLQLIHSDEEMQKLPRIKFVWRKDFYYGDGRKVIGIFWGRGSNVPIGFKRYKHELLLHYNFHISLHWE